MSTDNDSSGRPVAVVHAEIGGDSWRSVVHAQGAAAPDHSDWYAITGEVVDTLRCLSTLAGIFNRQVAAYGRDRVVRDDEPGHDPAERLAIASSWAAQLSHELDRTERTANMFWSEVGHIAVEVDR
ncbi:hypothetical protein BJF90_32010 [Pseudonocardia sp. CNS-004]|nr:hypothetical protein BJF90_32010 [Pseudonocardia sp. CNS-004]